MSFAQEMFKSQKIVSTTPPPKLEEDSVFFCNFSGVWCFAYELACFFCNGFFVPEDISDCPWHLWFLLSRRREFDASKPNYFQCCLNCLDCIMWLCLLSTRLAWIREANTWRKAGTCTTTGGWRCEGAATSCWWVEILKGSLDTVFERRKVGGACKPCSESCNRCLGSGCTDSWMFTRFVLCYCFWITFDPLVVRFNP